MHLYLFPLNKYTNSWRPRAFINYSALTRASTKHNTPSSSGLINKSYFMPYGFKRNMQLMFSWRYQTLNKLYKQNFKPWDDIRQAAWLVAYRKRGSRFVSGWAMTFFSIYDTYRLLIQCLLSIFCALFGVGHCTLQTIGQGWSFIFVCIFIGQE